MAYSTPSDQLGALRIKSGESEDYFRRVFENASIGIVIADANRGYLAVNDRFCKITGYDRETLLTMGCHVLVHPDDQAADIAEVERLVRGETTSFSRELRYIHANGSTVPVMVNVSVLPGQGEVRILGVIEDVTERKQAEEALKESENRFVAFMDNSPAIAWIKDEKGRYVYLSKPGEEKLGLSDILGKTDDASWPPDTAARFRRSDHKVLKTGNSHHYIQETVDKNGEHHFWLNNKFPLFSSKGKYVGGIGVEITRLTEAEQRLQEKDHLLSRAQEMAHVGHWEHELPSLKGLWSDETYRIFGLKPQECEVHGPFFLDHIHAEDRSSIEKALQDLVEGAKSFDEIFRIVRPDGRTRWVRGKGEVSRTKEGRPVRIFGTVLDITDRKQMEEALRESELKYRTLVEQANDGVIVVQDAIVKYVNPRMANLLGSTVEELTGSSIADHLDFVDSERVTDMHWRRVAGEKLPSTYEVLLKHRVGSIVYAELNVGVITYDGKPAAQVTVRDITERKYMEEELRRSRDELEARVKERTAEVAQLAAAVENAIDGIALCEGYDIAYANRAFSRITGYPLEELIGKDVAMLRSQAKPASLYQEMRESLARRRIWTGVYPGQKKDGTPIYVEVHASFIRDQSTLVVICHDITEKMRLEEEVRQAHKMEAIGALAGGIAHDFNNILAAVLGFGEIALEDTEQPHVQDSLKHVISAALRGRDLVRQILTFSRKSTREKKIVDLGPVIKETFNMLRAALPSTINMELSMKAENYTARADISGIPQIVMNICTNAAQAMPNGGDLCLSVTETKFMTRRTLPDPELKVGHYLVLSFTDNGTGMDKAVLSRVFEPFFTTKTSGQGTGMGLAVAYGIAKEHGGAITVESSPGKGSTFVVYLPLIHDTAKEEAPSVQPAVTGGHERVLFVDDEENITAVAQQMLTRLGYKVVTVDRPEHALELFKAEPDAFDLVITDQTMPNFTGLSLAKEFLSLRPDLPIILATGYSETVSPEKARKAGIREFLMKPMQKREWAETIRRVLDRRGN